MYNYGLDCIFTVSLSTDITAASLQLVATLQTPVDVLLLEAWLFSYANPLITCNSLIHVTIKTNPFSPLMNRHPLWSNAQCKRLHALSETACFLSLLWASYIRPPVTLSDKHKCDASRREEDDVYEEEKHTIYSPVFHCNYPSTETITSCEDTLHINFR